MQIARALHTGDIVYFTDAQTGQLLLANGFTCKRLRKQRIDDETFPTLSPSDFQAGLFKVTTELHYTAQEKYRDTLKKGGQTKASQRQSLKIRSTPSRRSMQGGTNDMGSARMGTVRGAASNANNARADTRLKYAAEEEQDRNRRNERKILRVYNDSKIQLHHELSGNFLCMSGHSDALLSPGSARSAFSLSSLIDSSFRTRDAVVDHDDVNLLNCKHGCVLNDQLQFPKITSARLHLRVHIYSPANTHYGSLRIGQSIRILLAASTEQSHEAQKSFLAAKPNNPKSLFLWASKQHLSADHAQNQNAECIFHLEPQPFHLDGSLEPPAGDLRFDCQFRLCHTISGKYLTAGTVFRTLRRRDEATPVMLSDFRKALQEDTRQLTLFYLVSPATLQHRGMNEMRMQSIVPATGTYVIVNYDPHHQMEYMLCKTPTGSHGQFKLCFVPGHMIGVGRYTTVQLQTVGQIELRRVREIEQWRVQLSRYTEVLLNMTTTSKLTINDAESKTAKLLRHVMSTLIHSGSHLEDENGIVGGVHAADDVADTGRPTSATVRRLLNIAEEDPGKFGDGFPDKQQQRRVRELLFIDALFDELQRLIRCQMVSPFSGATILDQPSEADHSRSKVVTELFKTIIRALIDNPANQHYIISQNRVKELIVWCNTEVWAIHTLAYLYRNNMVALQNLDLSAEGIISKLTKRIADHRAGDMAWRLQVSAPILRFLRGLVACNGVQLYLNQNVVLQRIYEQPRLLIQTQAFEKPCGQADRETILLISWPTTLFMPPHLFGKKLIPYVKRFGDIQNSDSQTTNLDLRHVAWTLEPDTCYKLCYPNAKGKSASTGDGGEGVEWVQRIKRLQGGRKKFWQLRQIARYYTEQILLAADCCAGRNKTSMSYLDTMFSFNEVLHGLQDGKLPLELRRAFAKLMRHKFLDHAPQERIRIPEPLRLYSEFSDKWVTCTKMKVEGMTESEKQEVDDVPLLEQRKKRALAFLDMGFMTLFLCSLVVFAVVVAFLESSGAISDERYDPVQYCMYTITVIFIIEVSIRGWAMGWSKFKKDPFCAMDLFVTIVDVLCCIVQFAVEDAEGGALNSAKSLRFIRVVRGLRFMRVLRLARYFNKAQNYILLGGQPLNHCYALEYTQERDSLKVDDANPLPCGMDGGGCIDGQHDAYESNQHGIASTLPIDAYESNQRLEQYQQMEQYFDKSSPYLTELRGRQHIDNVPANSYVSALLANLQALMRFGYFREVEDIRVLCWQLIILLDGRADMKLRPSVYDTSMELPRVAPRDSWKYNPQPLKTEPWISMGIAGKVKAKAQIYSSKKKKKREKEREKKKEKKKKKKDGISPKNSSSPMKKASEKWIRVRSLVKAGTLGKWATEKEDESTSSESEGEEEDGEEEDGEEEDGEEEDGEEEDEEEEEEEGKEGEQEQAVPRRATEKGLSTPYRSEDGGKQRRRR
jgi:hypothetical protein